jgi:hypothetical protein
MVLLLIAMVKLLHSTPILVCQLGQRNLRNCGGSVIASIRHSCRCCVSLDRGSLPKTKENAQKLSRKRWLIAPCASKISRGVHCIAFRSVYLWTRKKRTNRRLEISNKMKQIRKIVAMVFEWQTRKRVSLAGERMRVVIKHSSLARHLWWAGTMDYALIPMLHEHVAAVWSYFCRWARTIFSWARACDRYCRHGTSVANGFRKSPTKGVADNVSNSRNNFTLNTTCHCHQKIGTCYRYLHVTRTIMVPKYPNELW